jgi:hypothetical protein
MSGSRRASARLAKKRNISYTDPTESESGDNAYPSPLDDDLEEGSEHEPKQLSREPQSSLKIQKRKPKAHNPMLNRQASPAIAEDEDAHNISVPNTLDGDIPKLDGIPIQPRAFTVEDSALKKWMACRNKLE